jgi:uncharacterized protein (DUF302 family)
MKGLRVAIIVLGVVGLTSPEPGFTQNKGGGPMASSPCAVKQEEGIVTLPSNHSVDDTIDRLKGILKAKGITIFALVDHSGEAAKAGLKMPPTKLLIFGSPKAGTPLMLAAPGIAIDLPLKILVAESIDGKVCISYNSPEYLQTRYSLPEDLVQNIAVVKTLAADAAK